MITAVRNKNCSNVNLKSRIYTMFQNMMVVQVSFLDLKDTEINVMWREKNKIFSLKKGETQDLKSSRAKERPLQSLTKYRWRSFKRTHESLAAWKQKSIEMREGWRRLEYCRTMKLKRFWLWKLEPEWVYL